MAAAMTTTPATTTTTTIPILRERNHKELFEQRPKSSNNKTYHELNADQSQFNDLYSFLDLFLNRRGVSVKWGRSSTHCTAFSYYRLRFAETFDKDSTGEFIIHELDHLFRLYTNVFDCFDALNAHCARQILTLMVTSTFFAIIELFARFM